MPKKLKDCLVKEKLMQLYVHNQKKTRKKKCGLNGLLLVMAVLIATMSNLQAASVSDSGIGVPFVGYNLFSSLNATTAYLMDNDGNMVHSWDTGYPPGNSMYLMENGELLVTGNVGNTNFGMGGAGGVVQSIDWDGNVTWAFEYSSTMYLQHHDIAKLPSGNVLMIAWEYKTAKEALSEGRNPSLLGEEKLFPDSIIEVQPTGATSGAIVWEWHVWDHLVQDFDSAKPNYGVVAEHPELIDLNYVMNSSADWNHTNSIDYNAELDQIVLSVHNFSEIWIIDHSTTINEAAGHSGGNSGKGGDLIYRWGNPQTYDAGTEGDQQLFVQHDAEWIDAGCPGEGNIIIFNNGQGRSGGNYSSIDEIVTPVNPDGSYFLVDGSAYGPDAPIWTYTAESPTDFFAKNISGQQRLANGNTLICDGPGATFFEVTDTGEIIWEYTTTGAVFRVERYAPDYSGFDGTDLDDGLTDTDTGTGTDSGNDAITMSYPVVDTGQVTCYNDMSSISSPIPGDAYYGQDAQYDGNQPSYTISADGLCVYDNVTGLTWMRDADLDGDGDIDVDDKMTFEDAQSFPDTLNAMNFGGYSDWRVPTIKELYSLIDFRGTDPHIEGSSTTGLTPFIDTDIFAFAYGDTAAGERIIDSQWVTNTVYVGEVFDGMQAMFGVNFADGRIKGYGLSGPGGSEKTFYVLLCRGNIDYGINKFVDNGDNTVTDNATGLMWAQDDSGAGMNWEAALAWVEQVNAQNYLGHDDWRLPNAKELQSIVDYNRSPDTTNSAAIDPVFNCSQITNQAGQTDYPFYWTGTTHVRQGGIASAGAYVAFVGVWEPWMA
jgi:hypothetical protein